MAKVSGSRRPPYRVDIIVPSFFEDDIDKLLNELIKYPVLLPNLLNRELDPEILIIAERLGLKVFPRKWTDFKMNCNCPDWAVPCKHLASVIYTLSREIYNNPFLVFEIHKVKLLEELSKRGIHIEPKRSIEIPLYKDLINIQREKGLPAPIEEETRARSNFTVIKPIGYSLMHILADDPPFMLFIVIYGGTQP